MNFIGLRECCFLVLSLPLVNEFSRFPLANANLTLGHSINMPPLGRR